MRRSVVILLAVVVIVAMLIGIWRYVRPLERTEQLILTSAQGDVVLHNDRRRVQPEATAGTALRADDHLTTGDGRAVLELEGGTRVRVGPSSSVLIVGVDETGVQLELEGGALKATVRPESGTLAVAGAGVTAQATDADFAFAVAGGLAVLQADRGDVGLMGADASRVEAGTRAVIAGRTASVGPIPDDVLLAVKWPETRRTRETMGIVRGTTAPGATVAVRSEAGFAQVQADGQGLFEASLPLAEGANPVDVIATDVFGESTRVHGVLQTRDTAPPTLKGSVEYPR